MTVCNRSGKGICLHQKCPEKQLILNGNQRRETAKREREGDGADMYTAVFHPSVVILLCCLHTAMVIIHLLRHTWTQQTNHWFYQFQLASVRHQSHLAEGSVLIKRNKWYAINYKSNLANHKTLVSTAIDRHVLGRPYEIKKNASILKSQFVDIVCAHRI